MTDDPAGREHQAENAVPHAVVQQKASVPVVWLIPLVAALVGLYLAYVSWSEQGPTIQIRFETAEGFEAGKTKIKFKDVEIGLVETVRLSDDISGVIVTANLVHGVEPYMTESTRFWAVRASFTAGQVSGLSTVLSGVYIAIDPSSTGDTTHEFIGLEKPPIMTSDKPGSLFDLRARELGSIQIGSPVYYRWLNVGQVAGFELDAAGEFVNLQVFVESPHDRRIRSTTRFWNVSGFDATLTSDGLRIDTPSLMAMILGGVAFDTPTTSEEAVEVPKGMVFRLYENKTDSLTKQFSIKNRYLLDFGDSSVAGLSPGARVVFRGIKIGEVLDVDLDFNPRTNEIHIPVLIEIEPERLGLTADQVEGADIERLSELVNRGFRAKLETASLLTGQKLIEFAMVEDAEPAEIVLGGAYPMLPTTSGGIDALTASVSRIVSKVDRIPIESIGNNLDGALAELQETLVALRRFAGAANDELLPGLTASLAQLEGTLASANSMIAPDSAMVLELERLVRDLAQAARSIRVLAERLEEHPEELIRGKSE